jgi:hypothetical protein
MNAGIETITINEFRILCKKNNITKATKITAIINRELQHRLLLM